MLLRPRLIVLLGALLVATAVGRPSHAGWFARKTKGVVTGALRPSINTLVSGAKDLAKDVDKSLERRLDQAHSITSKIVADVDGKLAKQVAGLDQRMEARILQITTGANDLVGNALGRLDEISRKRIDQLGRSGEQLITELDAVAASRLRQVDDILRSRLDQVDTMLTSAIREADSALEARIDQLDEAIGRRLGNVDVIVSKQRLGLETTLARFAVAAAACALIVLVLWRLHRDYRDPKNQNESTSWFEGYATPALRNIGAAVCVVIGIYFVLPRLPLGAEQQLAELTRTHERAYQTSLANFDFIRARHHASQLELLQPSLAALHKMRAEKATLFKATFGRPTALATTGGRATVQEQLRVVEGLLGDRPDPDVLVIRAFVLWHHGERRMDEYRAASLCARALRQQTDFALAPLARNYTRAFVHSPYVPTAAPLDRDNEALESLRTLAGGPDGIPEVFALRSAIAFDWLVRRLETESTPAYLGMLDAHAAYLHAMSTGTVADSLRAQEDRTKAAAKVLRAWREFDAGLREIEGLETSPSILALFALNDAMLSRALWFYENKTADDLAPVLKDIPDVVLRAKVAPPRIAWVKRYGDILGYHAQEILNFEEAERFDFNQELNAAFDQEYVRAQLAELDHVPEEEQRAYWREAGILAARLGLYVETAERRRVPLAWAKVPQVQKWLAPLVESGLRAHATGSPTPPASPEVREQLDALEEALSERTSIIL